MAQKKKDLKNISNKLNYLITKASLNKTKKSLPYFMKPRFWDWFYGEDNDMYENASKEQLSREYVRYFISRIKPYRKFRPFKDPNNYIKKKRKFLKDKNNEYKSFFTILNELNFDDDEIRKQLYKYNNALFKYKHFKFKHNSGHKSSYFSSVSGKIKHVYVKNSLNSVCNLYMPAILFERP